MHIRGSCTTRIRFNLDNACGPFRCVFQIWQLYLCNYCSYYRKKRSSIATELDRLLLPIVSRIFNTTTPNA